ncbi:MAG: exo-alpha-sialidase [Bacteroidota bacterium]
MYLASLYRIACMGALLMLQYNLFGQLQTNNQYKVRIDTIYAAPEQLFLHARTAAWSDKGKTASVMTTSSHGFRTHAFGDLYVLSKDAGNSQWSVPKKIEALALRSINDSLLTVIGDVTPGWHEKSRTVLCTGKSFFYRINDTAASNKRMDVEGMQEVAYATYDPAGKSWSGLQTVKFPPKLNNGDDFAGVNAGCTQRVDLADGTILLPVRYVKNKKYITTVIQCSYDGKSLKYLRHGSTFSVPIGRGLYEPSVMDYKNRYFLTMRADSSGYVARSNDGLNFEPMKEWVYDDGEVLGSYNTQQHWISNQQGLFLVYTRKGAGNDHIYRHRAPLFIARVDPDKLCIIRKTEQVLMPIPTDNGDQGNFGITHIDSGETWVTVAVYPPVDRIYTRDRMTRIEIAKIYWNNK